MLGNSSSVFFVYRRHSHSPRARAEDGVAPLRRDLPDHGRVILRDGAVRLEELRQVLRQIRLRHLADGLEEADTLSTTDSQR